MFSQNVINKTIDTTFAHVSTIYSVRLLASSLVWVVWCSYRRIKLVENFGWKYGCFNISITNRYPINYLNGYVGSKLPVAAVSLTEQLEGYASLPNHELLWLLMGRLTEVVASYYVLKTSSESTSYVYKAEEKNIHLDKKVHATECLHIFKKHLTC